MRMESWLLWTAEQTFLPEPHKRCVEDKVKPKRKEPETFYKC